MNNTQILTPIDSNNILQVDATIIAGILILLTVSFVTERLLISRFWGDPLSYVAFSMIPFVISAGLLLVGSIENSISEFFYILSLGFLVGGLVYLTISVFVIVYTIAVNKRGL